MHTRAIALIIASVVMVSSLRAQQISDMAQTSDMRQTLPNRLGVGLGLWLFSGAPILSVQYGRTLESGNVELEASVHSANFSAMRENTFTPTIPGVRQQIISYSHWTTMDATALFMPFSNLPRLKIGGGLTLLRVQSGSGAVYRSASGGFPSDSLLIRPVPFLGQFDIWLYGLNGKIEYSFPLANALELGGRVQGYALMNMPVPNGITSFFSAAAGIFCNVRF